MPELKKAVLDQMTSQIPNNCVESEISAYIDGELSPVDELSFENHIDGCEDCRSELNEQKLFLYAVNASLELKEISEVEVPANFTRTIVANAESKVSGLRDPQERSLAIWICSVILIVAIVAVGAESLGIFAKLFETISVLAQFAGNLLHMALVSFGVVLRSIAAVSHADPSIVVIFAATIFSLFIYVCVRILPKIRSEK